jgi:hypothetical protein
LGFVPVRSRSYLPGWRPLYYETCARVLSLNIVGLEAEMHPLLRDPSIILSTHLPPAIGQTSKFLDMLAAAPHADPFVGPDQHALEEMLAGFEPATTAE